MNLRKIILLTIIFQLFYCLANAQIKLVGNITTNGIAEYPTHIDSLSKGGYMSMPTIAARNAIPTLRRKYGMLVFVEADGVIYKLNAATLANADWVTFSLGATTNVDAGTLSGTTLNATITGSSLTSVGTLIAGAVPYSLLTGTTPTFNQNTTGNAATATTATTAGTATTTTGNAGTATKLATARTINGVAFDGSENINITASSDAGTLTGTTLVATVTGSSLTSVGTLVDLTVTNPIAGSITGNAATATTATTATTAGNITATINTTLTSLSNLATVGTITSGVWSGTAVAVANGGTGATTADAARTNLGLVIGTDVQAPLTAGTNYIVPNASITGATKTKLSYDVKGLVTAGADATTADIAASTNKNYVTDVQSGVLSNTSGTNTGDQTITLTGDVTGTGTGTFTSTLANSGVSASSYGSSTSIPTFSVDAKGRVTTASTASIVADAGTLTGTTLNATVTGSSLTSVGTITSGVWSGTAVAVAKGGTGLTAAGTNGQILTSTNTGTLTWTTATAAKFTNDVTIRLSGSNSLGKYANGATIPTAGKTLDEYLYDLVTQSIAPTYTAPTVSISSDKSASYEIGTNIGTVTLSKSFTQNNGGSLLSTTYYKDNVSLVSASTNSPGVLSTSISYSVTVTYGQGPVLNNNLGTPDATGQIPAGSKSSSLTISPFAYKYWGSSTLNSIDDATLRAGTNENSGKAKSSFTVPISGTKYIFYAYPASLGVLSSISVGGFDSFETFTLTTRDVTNASGYTQSYNIYISNNKFSTDVNSIIIN